MSLVRSNLDWTLHNILKILLNGMQPFVVSDWLASQNFTQGGPVVRFVGKRTVGPLRKTLGAIEEWTLDPRSRLGTHCPTQFSLYEWSTKGLVGGCRILITDTSTWVTPDLRLSGSALSGARGHHGPTASSSSLFTDVTIIAPTSYSTMGNCHLLREMTVGVGGSFPKYQRILLASSMVRHPLPALTAEAGSELALGSYRT
ncbi:hypothetical protein J6590_039422 [Homalodisca vitripennis]|nr:hypothetical protein J6590_039422 [Homalodisca vitripennis]